MEAVLLFSMWNILCSEETIELSLHGFGCDLSVCNSVRGHNHRRRPIWARQFKKCITLFTLIVNEGANYANAGKTVGSTLEVKAEVTIALGVLNETKDNLPIGLKGFTDPRTDYCVMLRKQLTRKLPTIRHQPPKPLAGCLPECDIFGGALKRTRV